MFRDVSGELTPTIKDFNDQLEDTLNGKIEQEKYHLYIPVPMRYVEEKKSSQVLAVCELQSETYDFYLFGQKSSTLSSLMDAHIYR